MAGTKYVRLREDLARGGRYDLQSGWGISGYDVKEMPDEEGEPMAFAFVTGEIRAGRIEPASRAEYDEVHPDLAADLGFSTRNEDGAKPFQERAVQREARKAHTRVKAKRNAEAEVDAFEVDQARREATIKAQKAQEGRASRRGSQKSAAEAEEDAERLNDEHLRHEAEVRSAGGSRVAGANLVDDADDVEDDEDEGDSYDEMGKDALKEEAERRGLAKSGSADTLRERLRAHDAEDEETEEDEEEESEEDTEDDTNESEDDGATS